jgi:predicted O-methyltransferase YrrM
VGAAAAKIVDRLVEDKPVFHSGGTRIWNAMPATMEVIARHVSAGDRTVETGAGASTVVFAAAGADHHAISPFGDEHKRIAEYCADLGVDTGGVTFHEGPSDRVLPSLVDGERYDLAFIDGLHSFPGPVVDYHYVEQLLRPGGVLLLDDVPIPAVAVAYRYMKSSPDWAFVEIVDDRAAVFRKIADADTEDNWRRQPFNRRYPDFSYLPVTQVANRARLEATERLPGVRRSLGQKFPALREAYLRRRGQ